MQDRPHRESVATSALRPVRGLVLALALVPWLVAAVADAQEAMTPATDAPLVLALCEGHVASAEIVPPPQEGGSFGVAISLLPEASEAFAELTGDHVGRALEIRIGRGHVVRATIRQAIRSGVITTGGYATRAEAEEVRTAALASRARACGGPEATPGAGAP